MTKMLKGSNSRYFSARWLRSTAVAAVGVGLGVALWTATMPVAFAQGGNATKSVQDNLPRGQTVANASKADLLAAVCAAVKKNPNQAPQIARLLAEARPDLAKDILRTVFRCLGNDDCRLLGRVLRGVNEAVPSQASENTSLALELSPDCAGAFPGTGGGGDDGGNFGQGPANQNPPPGTIGGGGGQGNVVAICHNGNTIFVSPQGAQNHLKAHSGDSLGPCVVTPATSQ
jgi:hypothetical protein